MKTSYRVTYTTDVQKFIKKNKDIGLKFFKAFKELSKNSNLRVSSFDIVAMQGYKNVYRLRIGQYRAVFSVEKEIKVLKVVKIESRGGIYKNKKERF